jgi:tetratricopeptide (TPR) repeat protein
MGQFHLVSAMAHHCAGRFEQAAACARLALQRQPDFVPALVSHARSCALAGRLDEARRDMNRALELNPSLSFRRYETATVMRRAEDTLVLKKGMLMAGMPS